MVVDLRKLGNEYKELYGQLKQQLCLLGIHGVVEFLKQAVWNGFMKEVLKMQ